MAVARGCSDFASRDAAAFSSCSPLTAYDKLKKLGLMGLYWGKKEQSWPAFLWGYLKDNVPYLFYLAEIPFRRLIGKKYYE